METLPADCKSLDEKPPFKFGVRLGMVFIAQSAFLSLLAITFLLSAIIFKVLGQRRAGRRGRVPVFRSSTDYLFVQLLVYELIRSIGYIATIRWIADAQITPGALCTIQGAFRHAGGVGEALVELAIAWDTFVILVLPWKIGERHWKKPWIRPAIVFASITTIQSLVSVLPALVYSRKGEPFYGEAGYWCWIGSTHTAERYGLQYAILWLVAVANILLYTPIFLSLRGNLVVTPKGKSNGDIGTSVEWQRTRGPHNESLSADEKAAGRVARTMLVYPLVYIILILPISLNRWVTSGNNCELKRNWPSEVSAFAAVVFGSSGLLNVLVYVITRPSLFSIHKWCGARRGENRSGDEEGSSQSESSSGAETSTISANLPTLDGIRTLSTLDRHNDVTSEKRRSGLNERHGPMLADDDDSQIGAGAPSLQGGGG